jgi:hypothetical protein
MYGPGVAVRCLPRAQWVDATLGAPAPDTDVLVVDDEWVPELVVRRKQLLNVSALVWASLPKYAHADRVWCHPPGSPSCYGISFLTDVMASVRVVSPAVGSPSVWRFVAPWCCGANSSGWARDLADTFAQFSYAGGGRVWDARAHAIRGVLDSHANEDALRVIAGLIAECGPDADCSHFT